MRFTKLTKKFDGKTFKVFTSSKTMADAKRNAEEVRESGNCARVTKKSWGARTMYIVWWRKK